MIKHLVQLESRWIPDIKGYSLYIRPTIIGTRCCTFLIFFLVIFSQMNSLLAIALGVGPSDTALLCIFCSPTGPFFRTGPKPVNLYAVDEHVRSWPGGTGEFKLSLNYAPTFRPQELAAQKGYDQCLWILGENKKVTEAGAMNFFVVLRRVDGRELLSAKFHCRRLLTGIASDFDVFTPPMDGTILPGVTRASCLELVTAHPSETTLPGLSPSTHLYPDERLITMADLFEWYESGKLAEIFLVGTAVVVTAVGRVGFEDRELAAPTYAGGLGPVARGLYQRLTDIQEGKFEWQGWSVPVNSA